MTTFIETPRFPDNVAYGSQMGFAYDTQVVILGSGHEQRNINWADALCRFVVQGANLTEDEKTDFVEFFRTVKGRGIGFRIRDWSDYAVDSSTGKLGTADTAPGSVSIFQLTKKYTWGSETYYRPITKPTSVAVYKNSILQTLTTHYTIDTTTGIVTFVSPPTIGDTLHWIGEFDVPARFDVDQIDATIITTAAGGWMYNFGTVPVVEVRV